jgi:hypothetical protein
MEWRMDDFSYRLICYLDRKDEIYHYSSKEHPKISKIAKFGCEMLQNTKNIALWNFQILSILVLRAGKFTTFGSKVVHFPARNTKILEIC